VGKDGKATGVQLIYKPTRSDRVAKARVVILRGRHVRDSRMLLTLEIAGTGRMATSSGQVGRNCRDSVGTSLGGHLPAREGLPPIE